MIHRLTLALLLIPGLLLAEASEPTPSSTPQFSEPYPAKPTTQPPEGWKISLLENIKVKKTTPLENGQQVHVKISVYALTPALGKTDLLLDEPGFQPELKNSQTKTLGAAITRFSEETKSLDETLQSVLDAMEKTLAATAAEEKKETPKKADAPKKPRNP